MKSAAICRKYNFFTLVPVVRYHGVMNLINQDYLRRQEHSVIIN